jgi:molecular chaperone DnaK
VRDTREALRKKDAAAVKERAEALRNLLKEAGVVIYAQSPEAPKRGAYAETKWPGGESEASPRARVVDAEYRESK